MYRIKSKSLVFCYVFLLLSFSGIFKNAIASGNDDLILPIKLLQGIPVTSIQIQGHNIPLMLDSGATGTTIVLNKNIVKKMHLKIFPTDKGGYWSDDTGKAEYSRGYIIPEIKIGNITMHNVSCQLVDQPWGSHDDGFVWSEMAKNGAIGLSLLDQFNVLIDYKDSHSTAIVIPAKAGI